MTEEKMIAYCGIICTECPAFIAKQTDSDTLRSATVEEWSSEEFPLTLEDINCNGCLSDGDVFKHCTVCEVRACGIEKGVVTCAHCTEYPCEKLEGLWEFLELDEARKTLDEIRETC
jgi:hypothetical protein